ncbi:unnamed protein product [Urochloa humidicola]
MPGGLLARARPVLTSYYKSDAFRHRPHDSYNMYTNSTAAILCADTFKSMHGQMVCSLLARAKVLHVGAVFASSLLRPPARALGRSSGAHERVGSHTRGAAAPQQSARRRSPAEEGAAARPLPPECARMRGSAAGARGRGGRPCGQAPPQTRPAGERG